MSEVQIFASWGKHLEYPELKIKVEINMVNFDTCGFKLILTYSLEVNNNMFGS